MLNLATPAGYRSRFFLLIFLRKTPFCIYSLQFCNMSRRKARSKTGRQLESNSLNENTALDVNPVEQIVTALLLCQLHQHRLSLTILRHLHHHRLYSLPSNVLSLAIRYAPLALPRDRPIRNMPRFHRTIQTCHRMNNQCSSDGIAASISPKYLSAKSRYTRLLPLTVVSPPSVQPSHHHTPLVNNNFRCRTHCTNEHV